MSEGHRRRLIDKGLNNGLHTFKQHEIMELLLFFSIPRTDTNKVAHDLIDTFGSLYNACNAPIDMLTKIPGIGKKTAEFLRLMPDFVREYELSMYNDKHYFSCTKEIGDYCIHLLSGRPNEVVFLLCFNVKNEMIKKVKISEGSPGEVHVEPRKIIEHITNTSTMKVILTHNHPGGSLVPSQQDLEITCKLKNALNYINVNLVDHIIVANNKYFSFVESKLRF